MNVLWHLLGKFLLVAFTKRTGNSSIFFLYSASAVSLSFSFSPSSDFMRWGEIVTVLRAFKSEPGRHANILEVKRWGWKVPLDKEDGENTQRDGRLHSQSSDQLVNISKTAVNWIIFFFLSVSGWHLRDIFKTAQKMDEKRNLRTYTVFIYLKENDNFQRNVLA